MSTNLIPRRLTNYFLQTGAIKKRKLTGIEGIEGIFFLKNTFLKSSVHPFYPCQKIVFFVIRDFIRKSRLQNSLSVFVLLAVCLLPQLANSQISTPTPQLSGITQLELDNPIERNISASQKHIYRVTMAANQYAKIGFDRLGIDVIIREIDKDGKIISQYDADPGTSGGMLLELASKTAESRLLMVETRLKSSPPGRYAIGLLEVRPATAQELALDETAKLLTQANDLWHADKYTEALPLAEKALAVFEKQFGENDDNGSQILMTIANIESDKGDYKMAESHYLRALKIKKSLLPEDDISLSYVLNNLGTFYQETGNYKMAESFFNQALDIRQKKLDPNDPLIAGVLLNLGNLSKAKGDLTEAAAKYETARKIRLKAYGPDSPEVAEVLNNLAGLLPDAVRAEQFYNQALDTRKKFFGERSVETGQTLYNMAVFYANAGNFDKAETYCRNARSIFEEKLGPDHPLTSYPVNLLAAIAKKRGDNAKAEELYLQAIDIKEKSQGPNHPDLASAYSNLANLYVTKNEIDKAIAAQTRANNILEYNLELNLTTGSELEKYYYIKKRTLIESQTLSLNFQTAPNSQAAINLAATTILQRKGRVLDAMTDSLASLRQRFNKEDQALLDRLNDTTTKLVGLILDDSKWSSADEHKEKIKALEAERNNLESRISRQSDGFYEPPQPITLKAVQMAVPANASLIEFALYSPISPKAFEFTFERKIAAETIGAMHYAAFVINSEGEVKAIDLGLFDDISKLITALRQGLADPKRKDVKELARAVDEKIMQPLRPFLGKSTQLLISPEGELSVIPFEALVDEQGHYLIENYAFSYLTSGSDLLRRHVPKTSKNKPIIIANPSFGEPSAKEGANQTTGVTRKSITATRNLSDTYFAPLDGTEEEARLIQGFFPDATILTGAGATETALKQIIAPEILHIATHGFFLEDAEPFPILNNSPNAAPNTSEINEIPLLRSGLALAGANRHITTGNDGIFTALEASGLNLWGTKLVVLSACNTGMGEVRNGEGVYGLRRAFVLAGTESLVMSLWSVSDYVTRELMTSYYKNLEKGKGRGDALRLAELEMFHRSGREHPFYWASFIQSGEWANLDGKR